MRIDAHQHFWRYDARQYPWIPAGSPLQRDWLPADLAALQAPLGFGGSIAVQARQHPAESDWLLGLADASPRIVGVVGWVDLQSPQVADELDRLSRHPRFVGVRHVVQDEPDDQFMLRPGFLRGIELLGPRRLAYDLLVYPHQLPACIELATRFPNQRFVVDHIAKPGIRSGTLEPWATQIRELALRPNVRCKVSGLITEADHAAWKPADFTPFLDVVFEAFTPRRLMFGSDWPVCLLAGSYPQVLQLVSDYLSGLDAATHDAIFGGNARAFYLDRADA